MLRQIFIASLMCLVAAGPAWCGCLQGAHDGKAAPAAAAQTEHGGHCETGRGEFVDGEAGGASPGVSSTACTHCGDTSMGEQPPTLAKPEPPNFWPGAALATLPPAWPTAPDGGSPAGHVSPQAPLLNPPTLFNLRILLLI